MVYPWHCHPTRQIATIKPRHFWKHRILPPRLAMKLSRAVASWECRLVHFHPSSLEWALIRFKTAGSNTSNTNIFFCVQITYQSSQVNICFLIQPLVHFLGRCLLLTSITSWAFFTQRIVSPSADDLNRRMCFLFVRGACQDRKALCNLKDLMNFFRLTKHSHTAITSESLPVSKRWIKSVAAWISASFVWFSNKVLEEALKAKTSSMHKYFEVARIILGKHALAANSHNF